MAQDDFLKNLTDQQEKLGLRIFDLILGRIFKKVYARLDEAGKDYMGKVFLVGDDKQKNEFVEKFISDFQKLFEEEAKNIEADIKEKIEQVV
ncbi:MAG: hypothetical protein WC711_03300 [Candidatus Staskawiczbacteria bacterium]|jgi:hypothetical protein